MHKVTKIYVSIAFFLLMLFHGTAWASDSVDSPFGIHPAKVAKAGYADSGFTDAQNIGVKWTRPMVYAFWFLVQPDLNSQEYDFSFYNKQYGEISPYIKILANIAPCGRTAVEGYCNEISYMPLDEQQYIAFVKAMVERFDGDGGSEDMPGLQNPIKYWQVGNEPSVLQAGNFAGLQQVTYTAIKEVCPDCQVLLAGANGFMGKVYIDEFDKHYKPILEALGGNYVDILDFHWYGHASGDYRGAKDAYDHIRSVLNGNSFPDDLPVWITEMGAYSGDPAELGPGQFDYPFQTERQQALDYFKRFIYPLSLGVKKVLAAFGLMEGFKLDGGYFDNTGLIYNGWDLAGETPYDLGLGVKKLSYYTYKKMMEIFEGSDWSTVRTISEGDNVYIYQVTKNGKPVHIVWWDYFDDPAYISGATKQVILSGLQSTAVQITEVVPDASTGAEITDYNSAFNTSTGDVVAGSITLNVGDSPVIIETVPDPPTVIDFPPVTASSSVTICGTAEPGATITVTVGSSSMATTTADALGDWCVSVSLSAGVNNMGITAKDQAGNESTPTALTVHRVDSPSMQLLKIVTLTTDADGGSARPEIIATPNRIFVLYLANIASADTKTFDVKIFDAGLDSLISQKTIVSPTDYGSPTDIRVTSDGQYLYAFFETATVSTTYLWRAKYRLDDNFERVAYTETPIATGTPMKLLGTPPAEGGAELLDDPAPLLTADKIFVITRLFNSIKMEGSTAYKVRAFDKDNLTSLPDFDLDLDLSAAADGRGRVASFLSGESTIMSALATTVANDGISETLDDSAQSDLRLVIMGQDWAFDPAADVLTIPTYESDDRENYVSGFKSDSAYYYINYKQATGSPPTGEQTAVVKVFDKNFNEVLKEPLRTIVWGPTGGEMRSSIEVAGNRLYSGQSSRDGASALGNAEISVYDISGLFGTYLQADFSSSAVSGTAPYLNVAFSDRSLGSPSSWSWDFGDGSTSTLQNPDHVYKRAGVYTVSLTISNGTSTNTITKTEYITVESCQNLPIRISKATPVYYPTIQDAYNAASDGDTIQSLASDFTETLIFNTVSVTLRGGYDCDYTTNTGSTAVKGTLTISAGTLTVENIVLQP